MVAFASNSLLCRTALASGSIDAVSFTSIRLAAGALTLLALTRGKGNGGSWIGAAALAGYGFAFSLAYLRLSAGTGALILFGTVQTALLGWGLARGERPRLGEWAGLVLALAGLVGLAAPGVSAPDPWGGLLMAGAGLSWAVYTVRGKGTAHPLAANAGNFARSLAFVAIALAVGSGFHVSPRGVAWAVASGALMSGVGYALWYAALKDLSATRAAIVQISVAPLAALGGVAFLGEQLGFRLLACGAAVLGGIALAVLGRRYN